MLAAASIDIANETFFFNILFDLKYKSLAGEKEEEREMPVVSDAPLMGI